MTLTSLWGAVLVLWVYEQRPFSDSLLQERSLGKNHLHWNPKQEITQDSRQLEEALASMMGQGPFKAMDSVNSNNALTQNILN